jgi:hypothetical protein
MVLRPHILRYKGKLRKVDSDKIKKIKMQDATLKEELSKTKAIPKMNFLIIFAGMFVFSSKFLYIFYNLYSPLNVLQVHEKHSL